MPANHTIDALRAAMEAEKAKATGQNFSVTNLEVDSSGLIRFLPDVDDNNPIFWTETRANPFIFPSAVGLEEPIDGPVVVRVPNMMTWKRPDPVDTYFKSYWKGDSAMRDYARAYYRIPTFEYTGFVVSWPKIDQSPPENPIRRFRLSKSLHERVRQGVLNAEFEYTPTHYDEGRDFKVVKIKKGEWNNYDLSAFSYKSRALNEQERAAIDKFGLVDLHSLLGEPPTAEQQKEILELFEDSLAGRPFNAEAHPNYRAWASLNPVPEHPTTQVQVPPKEDTLAEAAATMHKMRSKVSSTMAP